MSLATNVFPDPGGPLKMITILGGRFRRPSAPKRSSIRTISDLDSELFLGGATKGDVVFLELGSVLARTFRDLQEFFED